MCSSDLLHGFFIVSIIIAAAQNIGTEHDTAFYFGAEAFGTAERSHFGRAGGISRTETVTDAVITGQISGSLRRSNNIIGNDRIFGMRQGNLNDLSAHGFVLSDCFFQFGMDFGVQAFAVIFFRQTDTQAFNVLGHGAAYYDRFLAGKGEAIAIAAAWDVQLVPDVPVEAHDVIMTEVVTDRRHLVLHQ